MGIAQLGFSRVLATGKRRYRDQCLAGGERRCGVHISKTDAWSAHGRLLKVGRLRVHLPGAGPGTKVLQHLDTYQGEAEFAFGPTDGRTTVRLWVDANAPIVRCEILSDAPQVARIVLEPWRTQPRELLPEERDSAYGLIGSSKPIVESADTIVEDEPNTLTWYHRNEESIWAESLVHQGMGGWVEQGQDPLLRRKG